MTKENSILKNQKYSELTEVLLKLSENEQFEKLMYASKLNPATNSETLTELYQFLFTQPDTQPIKRLRDLINQIQILENHLVDPLDYYEIDRPYIFAPQGITYELTNINKLFKPSTPSKEMIGTDPLTQIEFKKNDVIENQLFTNIQRYLKQPKWNMNKLLKLFSCPLSHEIFKNPVLANDGITYEYDYISTYVNEFKQTPTGIKQTAPLYPNQTILNYLNEEYIQNILREAKNNQNQYLSEQELTAITQLNQYIEKRLQEAKFLSFIQYMLPFKYGYNKWDKINAAINAKDCIRQQDNKKSLSFFKSSDYQICSQGRLQEINVSNIIKNKLNSIKVN